MQHLFNIIFKYHFIIIIVIIHQLSNIHCAQNRTNDEDNQSVDELIDEIIKNQSNATTERNHFNIIENQTIPNELNNRKNFTGTYFFQFLPSDLFNETFRHNGGFIIHFIIFIYFCLVLALIIDSYFIPSLQYFSIVYNLSPNIIGSTFMVIGTSLPELLASIMNEFVRVGSIGTLAIVVSSIFNVLAIPGICGLIALSPTRPMSFIINSWPIRREIIFYSITIIVIILGIKDDCIDWMESLVFIFIYIVYMFCLYLWSHFEITQQNNKKKLLRRKDKHWLKYAHYLQQTKLTMKPMSKKRDKFLEQPARSKNYYAGTMFNNSLIHLPLLPFKYLFKMTIPTATEITFIGTYLIANIWIVTITYLLIWLISIINETFHFTKSGSIITMLALGNITKLISSIIVVNQLHLPEMAICHVIASNIFNTLICLGLPWFLKIFMLTVKEGSTLEQLHHYTIPLDGSIFEYVAISLTLLLIIFILISYLNKWKLTFQSSILFLSSYLTFLVCLIVFDQYISIV